MSIFWYIICFPIIILLQFQKLRLFRPICFAKIQRLISQAPVTLYVLSCEPQVASVLPWADTKQCTGKFFDWSFSFNRWYYFQCICFHFNFHCFSFLSGLWGASLGVRFLLWCSRFLNFFILKKHDVMSHFLPSWLLS